MNIPTCDLCKEDMRHIPPDEVIQTVPVEIAREYARHNFVLHTNRWWECPKCKEYFYEGTFNKYDMFPG